MAQIWMSVFACVYLTVSQVSLQLGHFFPQLLQLLLAGLHLLPLFSFLPFPLLLQPLDDSLLGITEEGERNEGCKLEEKRQRESNSYSHSLNIKFLY